MSVNEKMTAIADSIRSHTDGTEPLGLDEMAEQVHTVYLSGVYDAAYRHGYEDGCEEGQKAEYDRFWDAYQQNGNRTHYVTAFSQLGWTDITYQPKYPIIGHELFGLQQVFSNSQVVDTKVDIILRDNGNMGAIFNGCTHMKRIPSLILETPATNLGNAFTSCINLEEIYISRVNDGCFAVSLDMHWSTKLNKASIKSIIDALSTTASGQILTLSRTAVTTAFGSTETAEWKDLIGKRDWSFSLV